MGRSSPNTGPKMAELAIVGILMKIGSLPIGYVDGHAFQINPISRQYLRTSEFNDGSVHSVEKHADAYNGGGPVVVKARQYERTDPDVLRKYGGGEVWPPAAAWDLGEIAANGNYLENDDIAVSHGVCGDTPQSGDDNEIVYSTPNSEWGVLESFEAGSIVDLDIIFTNYHWGHVEYFLCCAADLDDPDGVVTQSCFNKHPLDRAEDDSFNSPVDTNYPGRFYIDPPCRGAEVDQTRPELEGVLNEGNVAHVRYKLPDIVCEHAILQMAYHSGTGCRSPGYDEFDPPSWPSECAPTKEDWIEVGSAPCNRSGAKYGNVFWNCADIALTGTGGGGGGGGEEEEEEVAVDETPVDPEPTTPTDSSEEFMECYADKKDDRIMGAKLFDSQMTTSVCRAHCLSADLASPAMYYGTQYGSECWCGISDTFADYDKHGPGTCDVPCTGDSSASCGGFNAFSLYRYLD